MKKILASVIAAAFFFMPSASSAKSSISDNDLGAIVAQAGSITITFDDIYVKSKDLKSISTDGWNYWDGDHNVINPHLNNADGFFDGTPEDNPQQNPGFGEYNQIGYLGYADVKVTGGQVKRSGSMILEVFTPEDDPTDFNYSNVSSRCRVDVKMIDQRIEAGIGIEAAIKLGTTSDLSGNQYLGRVYTSGVSATTNGHLTVYAHNNSAF
ncbi:MAG: hypothetical protein WC373_14660 [Smithella sp.]|jgi:hypothetical protein